MASASDSEIADAVGIVFRYLTDRGAEEFEALCRREMLLWRCRKCNANVARDEEMCDECQTPAWGKQPA